MHRRKFLTGLATIGGVSLAGCSVISDDNTGELKSQLDEKNQTIANLEQEVSGLAEERNELEQEVSNLEEERNEFEQQISELEQEIEEAEKDISELEEQRETLIVERMTTLYESAEKSLGYAEEAYSTAETALEEQTTTGNITALNRFREAWGRYTTATQLTFEIVELADDEGYSDARDLAGESNMHASNMREACDLYSVAAQYFIVDDSESGNKKQSQGNEAFNDAQQYEFVSSDEFANTVSA